jgi:hypothetical protein
MPLWAREFRRRWRYFLPRLIWYGVIAAYLAAWICLVLPTGDE